MRALLILILNFFAVQNSFGQDTLAKKDIKDLQKFWNSYRNAIQTQNTKQLTQLIKLPFSCENYVFDTINFKKAKLKEIDKENVESIMAFIFFNSKLKQYVQKSSDVTLPFIPMNEYAELISNKSGVYSFCYKKYTSTDKWEDCFTLKRVDGKYRIVSCCTLKYANIYTPF